MSPPKICDEERHNWITRLLAVLIACGIFAIIFYMLVFGMPERGTEALLVLLGTVGTAFNSIIGYYYGNQQKPAANGNGNGNENGNGKPPEVPPSTPPKPVPPKPDVPKPEEPGKSTLAPIHFE
jgi:hypothetical protein